MNILSEGTSIDCVYTYACLFVYVSGSIYRKVNENTFNVRVIMSIQMVIFKIQKKNLIFFHRFQAINETAQNWQKWSAIFPIFG